MSGEDGQMAQMCTFIKQEAKEKVNEIRLKTQSDANLESSMMVHAAKNKIQTEVKEKEKLISMKERIRVSRAEAELRVRKMKVREDLLEKCKAEAVKALESSTGDKAKYQDMLRDLIVQGLIKLNEPKVEVIAREADADLVKKVKDAAVKKYIDLIKSETGQNATCAIEVNPNGKCLPPANDGSGKASCAGGVKLLASNGRIVCDNTLDSRLATSFDELMPEVRSTLFSIRV
mmetsp:Transcript_18582/g.32940  ORF Transcript_18582/g.32940 Transcript_18582/m.32940 type:complete len:232 (+) Transcript_18582:231-926(+)